MSYGQFQFPLKFTCLIFYVNCSSAGASWCYILPTTERFYIPLHYKAYCFAQLTLIIIIQNQIYIYIYDTIMHEYDARLLK